MLPKFIAGNQSAFVKDRLLIENLLLATELVKDYHKDTISSRCAIKIDISKAFDSIQWSFLINVLTAMHFPPSFIHWIHLCITSASFSIQVNGNLAGFFQSSRGLRQGCALSPYLFVISMEVLSKMLDTAAGLNKFGYHPSCKKIGLTHLSFADDLMVLSDGKIRSMDGIAAVFDEFAKRSGLRISMEKSTIYLAGAPTTHQQSLITNYPFAIGTLPVRYLGLPLVTKRLTSSDYLPLIEQIRKRIGSWTARFLSFAGRLNLISSIIWSICNFWLAAFRLPRDCIKEIEKLCSAFLWSGAAMNPRKAKVLWDDVCKPKQEGGLGLRSLKEANDVCCLKLVWKIASHGKSFWVQWIETYLLKKKSFWSLKNTTTLGSWIWKKLLKYRELAKSLCKVDVGNGKQTSFWFDKWSDLGRLVDVAGERGIIDMGITRQMSLSEAWTKRRRRRHRASHLNIIEDVLATVRQHQTEEDDVLLWMGKEDKFRAHFSTRDTWNHIRMIATKVFWHKAIWFIHETPKYSFCVWLAVRDRLSTGNHMATWNRDAPVGCVFCNTNLETRDHLFFSCVFTSEMWEALAKNIFKSRFTTAWTSLIAELSSYGQNRVVSFLARYVFQASVYALWRERNGRRHGEKPNSAAQLIT